MKNDNVWRMKHGCIGETYRVLGVLGRYMLVSYMQIFVKNTTFLLSCHHLGFSSSKCTKTRFLTGLCTEPHWGRLYDSHQAPSQLERGTLPRGIDLNSFKAYPQLNFYQYTTGWSWSIQFLKCLPFCIKMSSWLLSLKQLLKQLLQLFKWQKPIQNDTRWDHWYNHSNVYPAWKIT